MSEDNSPSCLILLMRWIAAIGVFFLFWVGSAQLGIYLLGTEDDGIIIFALLGCFLGVWFGMSTAWWLNPITLKPLDGRDSIFESDGKL